MARHNKNEKGGVHWKVTATVALHILWALLSASLLFTYCVIGYYLFFFSLENPPIAGVTLALLMLGPVLFGLTTSSKIRYSAWRLISISVVIFMMVPALWQLVFMVS